MTGLTQRFADYAASIQHGDLPAEVEARTRFLILDLAGNMLRGRVEAESSAPLLAAARAMGLMHGNHVVWAGPERASPLGAARSGQRIAGRADALGAPPHDLFGQLDRLDQVMLGVEVQ